MEENAMFRLNWRLLAPLACGLSCMLTGCFRGDEHHFAVTAAAGTGQVTTVRPVTQWRRKPLSLRLLGRVLDQPDQAQALPGAISPAVVTWAARGIYPDGVDEAIDLASLGDRLFNRLRPTGLSPADRVTSSR
jgi:hypothetical protein